MNRTTVLQIRMTAEERHQLDEAARGAGIGTGPWLRMLGLQAAAARTSPGASPPPPSTAPARAERPPDEPGRSRGAREQRAATSGSRPSGRRTGADAVASIGTGLKVSSCPSSMEETTSASIELTGGSGEVGAWARCTLCQARVQLAPPAPGRTRARIPVHEPAARPRKERLPNHQLQALLLAETGGLERTRGGWRSIDHLSYPQRATVQAVQQLRAAGALAEDGWKLVPTRRGRRLLSGYPPLVAR